MAFQATQFLLRCALFYAFLLGLHVCEQKCKSSQFINKIGSCEDCLKMCMPPLPSNLSKIDYAKCERLHEQKSCRAFYNMTMPKTEDTQTSFAPWKIALIVIACLLIIVVILLTVMFYWFKKCQHSDNPHIYENPEEFTLTESINNHDLNADTGPGSSQQQNDGHYSGLRITHAPIEVY